MKRKDLDELVKKYYDGTISSSEMKDLDKWLNDFDDTKTTTVLPEEQIKSNIFVAVQNKIESQSQQKKTTRHLYKTYLRLAASILLILAAGIAIFQFRDSIDNLIDPIVYQEVHIPTSNHMQLTLHDGSQVWLNAESHFRFPKRFKGSKREVFIEGEAFFQIKKNAEKPFIVHMGEVDVRVTGTSFNVKNYKNEKTSSVTLTSGKVILEKPSLIDNDSKPEIIAHMSPGQQILFNNHTKTLSKLEVDTNSITSWVNGKLEFRNSTFEDIATTFERWYGVRILFEDQSLSNCRLTVNMSGMHYQEAVDLLREVSNTDYKKEGKILKFIGNGCINN